MDTTSQAKQNAKNVLANNADCFALIFKDSKWDTVDKAQQQLDLRDIAFRDLGAPILSGTSPNDWGGTVTYGGNNGATIYLNSQLFPDDTTIKFDVSGVPGVQASTVGIFNHTYGTNLTGVQVEQAVILHELWHIAGGTADSAIDSDTNKKLLITTCIK